MVVDLSRVPKSLVILTREQRIQQEIDWRQHAIDNNFDGAKEMGVMSREEAILYADGIKCPCCRPTPKKALLIAELEKIRSGEIPDRRKFVPKINREIVR